MNAPDEFPNGLYKRPLAFILIFVCVSFTTWAQTKITDLLDQLPYKTAKEGEFIYLHQYPSWEDSFSSTEIGVDFSIPTTDAPYANRIAFANRNYGKPGGFFRFFDTRTMSFQEKIEGKSASLEGFIQSSYADMSARALDPRENDGFIMQTLNFTKEVVLPDSYSWNDVLAQINRSNYDLEYFNWSITEGRKHIWLDFMLTFEELKGKKTERHWVLLDIKTGIVTNDILVPYSDASKGVYITLEPYGINDMPPTYVGMDGRNYNQGYNRIGKYEPGLFTLASPGSNFVLARYRDQTFWDNRFAVTLVDMQTGERTFIPPPREDMKLNSKEFINTNYGSDVDEAMWLTRNSRNSEDYEVLFAYKSSDSSYMTVSSFLLSENSGVQLVLQNASGEYFDRMPKPNYREYLPIQRYRIRKLNSTSVIGEYTLLSSSPLKVTENEKYIVFMEGTPRNSIITLRDKFTGRLIDSAPGVSSNELPLLVENKDGVLVYYYRAQRLFFSLLNFR